MLNKSLTTKTKLFESLVEEITPFSLLYISRHEGRYNKYSFLFKTHHMLAFPSFSVHTNLSRQIFYSSVVVSGHTTTKEPIGN